MPKVIRDDKEVEIDEGEMIKGACKELGVPFGCEDGQCGVCESEILEGMENLSEPTDNEAIMGVDTACCRLTCQCRIKDGDVKINPKNV